jgi:hypothetical protein
MTSMGTCGELADFLARQPRDRKVILEKDAEGNGYSPLATAGEMLYEATSTWSGEAYPAPEDIARWVAEGSCQPDDYTERDDTTPGIERAIVLGPVN